MPAANTGMRLLVITDKAFANGIVCNKIPKNALRQEHKNAVAETPDNCHMPIVIRFNCCNQAKSRGISGVYIVLREAPRGDTYASHSRSKETMEYCRDSIASGLSLCFTGFRRKAKQAATLSPRFPSVIRLFPTSKNKLQAKKPGC